MESNGGVLPSPEPRGEWSSGSIKANDTWAADDRALGVGIGGVEVFWDDSSQGA